MKGRDYYPWELCLFPDEHQDCWVGPDCWMCRLDWEIMAFKGFTWDEYQRCKTSKTRSSAR